MTLRVIEIHRVLKPHGSFYLHCDPTASHYLKLVLDGVFCGQGGDFKNEIIWSYKKWAVAGRSFSRNHDVILFYTKSSDKETFNQQFQSRALDEVRALTTQHDLMLEGAIETLNEAVLAAYGVGLVDGDDPLEINGEVGRLILQAVKEM